jgi:hypothetical protein
MAENAELLSGESLIKGLRVLNNSSIRFKSGY